MKEINPKQSVVIIGCGYTGERIGKRCIMSGAEVHGIVRTEERRKYLQTMGINGYCIDFDRMQPEPELSFAKALIFYCMPPPSSGGADDMRMAGFIRWLDNMPIEQLPQAIVYLSSTSVYGDCHGAWVTEQSLPAPLSPRGSRRLAAENRLMSLYDRLNIPMTILRVAAIYGPGRLPVNRIKDGMPILNEDASPLSNRIHVDDLADVAIAASLRSNAWQVYNVSDGHPNTMTHYFNRVADLVGLQRPRTVSWEEAQDYLTPGMLDFLKESKKIDNLNMLHKLDIELKYPDIDSGIRASIEEPA